MIKAQNFINGYLEGTRIIDVKDYYSLLAQYESESPREKLPLHIYTINYIDKYRFSEKLSNKGKINIFNDATGAIIEFDVLQYLEDSKPIFEGIGIEEFDVRVQSEKQVQIILQGATGNYILSALNLFDKINKEFSFLVDLQFQHSCELVTEIFLAIYSELENIMERDDIRFENIMINFIKQSNFELFGMEAQSEKYIDKHFEQMCNDVTTMFVKNHSKDYLGGSISDALVEEFEKYYVSEISRTLAEICTESVLNDFKNKEENKVKVSSYFISKNLENGMKLFFQDIIAKNKVVVKAYLQNHVSNNVMSKLVSLVDNEIVVCTLHAWEVLGRRELDKYLNCKDEVQRRLKLENLYIGQSQGVTKESNVLVRLKQHPKFQEILALCPKNKEVALLFLYSTQNKIFFMPPGGENGKSKIEDFLSSDEEVPPTELVNLCEIGLINFFKPSKNTQHVKGSFSYISTNKFNALYKKYDGLIIELDCSDYKLEIWNEYRTFMSEKRYVQCRFNSDFKIGDNDLSKIFCDYSNDE